MTYIAEMIRNDRADRRAAVRLAIIFAIFVCVAVAVHRSLKNQAAELDAAARACADRGGVPVEHSRLVYIPTRYGVITSEQTDRIACFDPKAMK